MAKDIQLIIPMSGVGQRFINAGYTDPKPLIPVDGYPIIKHVVDLFPGTVDVTFICNDHHLATTPMESILTGLVPGCRILSVPVNDRKGPVETVMRVANAFDDARETIVSYCDYGTAWDYPAFLADVRQRGADGAIACYTGFHPHMLGSDNYAFVRETNGRVDKVQEKQPFTNNKMDELASNGTYYFKSGAIMKRYFADLMETGPSINGEFYVSVVYNNMIRDGLHVSTFLIDKMLQWGTPYDLEIYRGWSRYFADIIVDQPPSAPDDKTTLILPMAGHGSRFKQRGYSVPKPFLDVNGAPMFVQAVRCLPPTGKQTFICLEEHLAEYDISDTLNRFYPGSAVVPIAQTTAGQACTCEIGIAATALDDERPILISACDNGVYYDKRKYDALRADDSVDVIVWSFRNNQTSKVNPHMYSWLDVDADDRIRSVSCKKFIFDDPLKTHAIIGTMFFRKAKYFLDGFRANVEADLRTSNEFYVDDVINRAIEAGLTVKVFEVEAYICWGTPDDYESYLYWRDFFDQCPWHPYRITSDQTHIPTT